MTVLIGSLTHTATDGTLNQNPQQFYGFVYTAVATGVPSIFKFDASGSATSVKVGIYAVDANSNPTALLYEGSGSAAAGVNSLSLSPVGSPGELISGTKYSVGVIQNGYNALYTTPQTGTSRDVDNSYVDIATESLNDPFVFYTGASTDTPVAIQIESTAAVPGLPSDILQFEGAALANLTGLQVFMTAGSVFWGTVIHDDTAATTDASGRYAAITPTSGAVGDSVLLYFLTADGKGVVVPKTLEDIS